LAELVEDTIPVILPHLGVDVEAAVADLRDALGEELDAVRGVAEDHRLVDV
jgi:hypothetical protein